MTKHLRLLSFISCTLIVFVVTLVTVASSASPGEAAALATPDRVNAPTATYIVTNTNDSGVGSLRQAILDANNNPFTDTIAFNIFTLTPQVVVFKPLTPLPPIAGPVTIDGTTQGGGHCHASLGHPCIVLDGITTGGSGIGLTISSPGGSTVRGLVINHFIIGIELSGYGGSHIEGNYIGTNDTGIIALGNGVGIVIDGSSNNVIGGTTAATRNLISGNANYGVVIGTATGNVVAGNYIGTDVTGTSALPNRIGVFITSASNNVIGGTEAGARNLISGNSGNQADDGVGVWIGGAGSTGNVVAGNYIGTDINGTNALPNHTGVSIVNASDNVIGGTAPGARNLISGNSATGGTRYGVLISGTLATGNTVAGNYIGTDVTGTGGIANNRGIQIFDASNSTIGGTTTGARNLISGNSNTGVWIEGSTATSNTIEGNYIGTDITGTGQIGNLFGIYIYNSANNLIGGTTAGARNLISGNGAGVLTDESTAISNTIKGNYIGTDNTGTGSIGNGWGIAIHSANNLIGGTTAGARNLISGNSTGVQIGGSWAMSNTIEGNYIGTDITGTGAIPNLTGIDIYYAANNLIGGTLAGARNLISGNSNAGVQIGGSLSNTIEGNYIGTDANGTGPIGNLHGIDIYNSANNLIGGTTAGARNLISGNSGSGVEIYQNSISMTVQGNFIGTDVTGQFALGNGTGGVVIVDSSQNTIGGTASGAGNLISGNGGNGVVIQDGFDAAMTNTVQGNLIGLAANGMDPLGNEFNGVFVMAPNNTIGGSAPGVRNVVSANGRGVYLAGDSNVVQGNYIGTDITGHLKRGNVGVGLRIEDSLTNTVDANVFGGNGGEGIDITASDSNVVQGNYIGVSNAGDDLGNASDGILVEGTSSHNLIGGSSIVPGNHIAHNGGNGVTIGNVLSDTAAANTISHNSIHANAWLGIDLGHDGVTANDAGDGDTGPNSLQNFPVLSATLNLSNVIVIHGTLNSISNTNFTLEFFSNYACDASGYGEGEFFLGTLLVTTDAGGMTPFNAAFDSSSLTGPFATATATDPNGNTSEFSRCVRVAPLKVYLPLIRN
jgi:parallel beta-helix repeat protein